MKILVTGSNGFLGAALVRRLLSRNERGIRCMIRPGSDRSRLDALEAEYPGGIELFTGTLSRADDCARAVTADGGVDIVYHVAAATGGAAADMFMNSVVATRNLLDAMVDAMAATGRRIKLVHVSSFSVYGVAQLPRGGRVDETTPLDPHPDQRDIYAHSKHRQEELVWQYFREKSIPLVVLRPGVIYGPGGGSPMSTRVGVNLFGLFLHLGRNNIIPLTFVDNCAEAIAVAAEKSRFRGEIYNCVDDGLLNARQFLARYRRELKKMPYVTVPYLATQLLSMAVEKYHDLSRGQLPAIFTRYKSASMWKGNTFSNDKLKSIGWRPIVSTDEGLTRHFEHLRQTSR